LKNYIGPLMLLAGGALFSAYPPLTQATEAAAATTPAPVALVYIQTNSGVLVYNVSAAGQLTKLPGSLFADTGQMEAVTGQYLISVGTDDLHSYKLATNGAVGAQAGEIDTQSYGGSQCGRAVHRGPHRHLLRRPACRLKQQ
jgi:phosphate-selective porin